MGRRQHVPLARDRRRVFEPYAADGLDRSPAEFTSLVPNARRRRSTSATCASTTTSAGSPTRTRSPDVARRPGRPGYADLLVVQNPATSSPGLAFLLATIDEYGADGWQDYWRGSSTTASRSSTAGPRPTTSDSPGRGRTAADRRQLRVEPAVRGAVRRPAARRLADRRSSSRRVSARSSSPGCCAAPTHPRPPAAGRLPRHRRFQRELPLNVFVFPANERPNCPRSSSTSP